MSLILTGPDSLREYLTGAVADGGFQDMEALSLGNFRSSVEAPSLSIRLVSPLQGVVFQIASGANSSGIGQLVSLDGVSLRWEPPGASLFGPRVAFAPNQTQVQIVSGVVPAQFLRIAGTPPFTVGACFVALDALLQNIFGMSIVPDAQATSGVNQYRATIIRNESGADVTIWSRYLTELADAKLSDQQQLGISGSGTLRSSSVFSNWPTTGWCQIRKKADGTLREVVYYASRTIYTLSIAAAGRGLLGTSGAVGASTDSLHCVPGVAIALDPGGVQSFGSGISVIANQNTAPAGVTWNLELTKTTGLQVARIGPGQQIGVWLWRQMPAGAVFSPNVYTELSSDFLAYN